MTKFSGVVHAVPKEETYQKFIEALEDYLTDQFLAEAFRSQRVGKFLNDTAITVKQLVHRTYPVLFGDRARGETSRAFVDGVKTQI
jgi:hypothetical protein